MQRLPISISIGALPEGFIGSPQEFANALVARLAAYVDASVSFFGTGAVLPTADNGPFLKTPEQVWYVWSASEGRYVPQTTFFGNKVGDTKSSYQTLDHDGWFRLDGRAISSIAGATVTQRAALESLFGVGGNLDNVQWVRRQVTAAITPTAAGDFNTAAAAQTAAANAIGAVTVTNPPTKAEVEAIRDNAKVLGQNTAATALLTENLRTATQNVKDLLSQDQTDNPRNPGATFRLYSYVFAGTN